MNGIGIMEFSVRAAELSIHILIIILGAYVALLVLRICRAGRVENKSMAERRRIFFFVFRVTFCCFPIYLGHAIGSEGTAIMTTPSSLVLFSIFIFGLIFLFRRNCLSFKKKYGLILVIYIFLWYYSFLSIAIFCAYI